MKVLYIDMDNVLVDFPSGIARLDAHTRARFEGPVEDRSKDRFDEVPGIFALMDPMPGALEAYRTLAAVYDTYILSTAPWLNPTAWSDKLLWVQRHLGEGESSPAYKRLILSHHKNLNDGAFLVDDREKNGADRFNGKHIHFGTGRWPDWDAVTGYLLKQADSTP